VEHGDGIAIQEQLRLLVIHWCICYLCAVCRADSGDTADNGRPLGFPTHTEAPLVSICDVFSLSWLTL